MHACELMANRCAMRRLRLHIGAPWQTADKGGRLSGEAAESMAQAVRNRFGAGNAMRCQVCHQINVIRQLISTKSLKQGQNKATRCGVNKKIAVFNTRGNALET
jgi:nitrate/TMAO reductase-like tetraheme cytochrome c subunit